MKSSFFLKLLPTTLSLGIMTFPTYAQAGLVPCGPGTGKPQCEFCDIFVLFGNVVNFVLGKIIPPIAILMLIIGGLLFYFSAGDPTKTRTAVTLLRTTIVGMLIVYLAGLIVGMVFVATGVANWEGWWWGNISC